MLAVGNCCYVAVCSAAEGASAPTGGRGAGHTVAAAAYSLLSAKSVTGSACLQSTSKCKATVVKKNPHEPRLINNIVSVISKHRAMQANML